MYDNVWQCMAMYGYVCQCMAMYGNVWLCMAMYGYVWQCMVNIQQNDQILPANLTIKARSLSIYFFLTLN